MKEKPFESYKRNRLIPIKKIESINFIIRNNNGKADIKYTLRINLLKY